MKNQIELALEVETFNRDHPVGSQVKIERNGKHEMVTVKSEATILGGHSAVAWFNEISGCFAIDKVVKNFGKI